MSWFGGASFDKSKLKANLKMAMSRMDLLRNKKQNLVKLQKKQIAELLQQQKDESARIKVENIIREDYQVESYDILQLFCDLLQTRIQLVAESKTCPHDLKEAVTSLIYAAPRLEVPELMEVRNQFALKYGKQFVENASENKDLAVNQRIIFKLGIKVPEPYLCVQYLEAIAREHNIEWEDTSANANNAAQALQLQQQQQQQQQQQLLLQQQQLLLQQQQLLGMQQIPPQLLQANPAAPAATMAQPQQPLLSFPAVQPQLITTPQQPPQAQPMHQQGPTLPGYIASGFNPNQPIPPQQPPMFGQQQPPMPTFGNVDPVLPHNAPLTGINPPMTFSNDVGNEPADSSGSYDFDELQKRFEALKKRE